MSFDLAVWGAQAANSQTAQALYEDLCARPEETVAQLPVAPGLQSFYEELTGKHPEIDSIPKDQIGNFELCPWSIAFDRSERHLILSCVWPKADYVGKLVSELAARHDLAVYDPQAEKLQLPGEGNPKSKPWWRIW